MGENQESQPQHVGFDDFYGFLSVSDMYTEWRDPYFFPEIAYSEERTKWIENQPFNKCFVHATRGGDIEDVEEVTIPVLSTLDDKWATYSEDFIRGMAGADAPWFLYHNTRGAHFDNYPLERFLGSSPAKHPYKDTIIELDDIVGRLVDALRDTGQLEHTMIFLSSDNGPEMETWPDAAYTPFRCAKGSTWEGGVRVPAIFTWPGMIEADHSSDGLFNFSDLFPTMLALAGAEASVPDDRFIDGIDQSGFLLAPDGRSHRKYHYYWLQTDVLGRALRRVQADDRVDLRRRPRRRDLGRLQRGRTEVPVRTPVQPLPRPEGDAQLPDPEARLPRGVHDRHQQAPAHLRQVPAEERDGRPELTGRCQVRP